MLLNWIYNCRWNKKKSTKSIKTKIITLGHGTKKNTKISKDLKRCLMPDHTSLLEGFSKRVVCHIKSIKESISFIITEISKINIFAFLDILFHNISDDFEMKVHRTMTCTNRY